LFLWREGRAVPPSHKAQGHNPVLCMRCGIAAFRPL
jgi:hypothetical protein